MGPLAWAAAPGGPGTAVPVHDFSEPCLDARYPALAGPWVVGCGAGGLVDRALSLLTGRELRFEPMTAPALGEGLLVSIGPDAQALRLREGGAERLDLPLVWTRGLAPPATDGARVALLEEGRVSAWALEERSRNLIEARPEAWFRPALGGERLAWVERGAHGQGEVWALDLRSPRARPERLAERGWHVVGQGERLAWVEPDALVLYEPASGEQERLPARTGFSAPPSLWEEVICWEERPRHRVDEPGDGVDILCNDGLTAAGPGHQRWPSRFGPWLLYRQDGALWLRTAASADPASPPAPL